MTTETMIRNAPGETGAAAGRWLMLTTLLAGQFMALLDVTIVNVAMPTIRTDLHTTGAALQLIVAGYTVSYAMLLVTGARLGDLFGRRRMYLIGLLIFTLSSLLCGLAPEAITLVAARFVQGAGAAMMMPQIMSMIQIRFTGQARATALSAYLAVVSVGAIAGMVLGGVLVEANLFSAGWRPVFLVNVPVGLALSFMVPRLVPADGSRGSRRIDVPGLVTATLAVFLVVLPLVLGHELHWPAWTFASIAAGLVLAVAFVLLERRIAARGGDPLLRLDVLRVPGVSSGLLALITAASAYGGFLFMFTLHLQAGLGDSALRASLTFAPGAAMFGLFGFYWRRLPARIHHLLTPIGFTLTVVAYLLVAESLRDGGHGGVLLQVGLLLFGAAMGTAFSPLLANGLVNVPLSEAADASGLFTTVLQLGQVIGVSTFGSIFLTLAAHAGPHPSASAITTALLLLAGLLALGVPAAAFLTRTVVRARTAG